MSAGEPRSVREGVLQEITERQWLALSSLLEAARARKESIDLSEVELERLDEALRALAGAQDMEHGLADEAEFFKKYPHLVPPWRRKG
jgi:hypothetical protein